MSMKDCRQEKISKNSRIPRIKNDEIFLQNFSKEKLQENKNESANESPDGELPEEKSRLLPGKQCQ